MQGQLDQIIALLTSRAGPPPVQAPAQAPVQAPLQAPVQAPVQQPQLPGSFNPTFQAGQVQVTTYDGLQVAPFKKGDNPT
eukprot:193243-Chlamydomonas_euryale.AAC.1